MALGITLEIATANLTLWLAASAAVATGQAYEIDTGNGGRRRLQRVDAAEIRNQIVFWQGQIATLTLGAAGGRIRTRYVVPE